jgi:AcrR family transcriptional regulator
MPRPKTLPDFDVLKAANKVLHEDGPDALTFAAVAKGCGLSAATLVQRFGSKAALKQAALLHAWDGLDEKTAALAASVPKTPAGAIEVLVGLSHYGDVDTYAEGLLVLREDLRDPALRARGARWRDALTEVLDRCFENTYSAPSGIGLLMASHWQGSLLWWGFDPKGRVEDHVKASLEAFVAAIASVRPMRRLRTRPARP